MQVGCTLCMRSRIFWMPVRGCYHTLKTFVFIKFVLKDKLLCIATSPFSWLLTLTPSIKQWTEKKTLPTRGIIDLVAKDCSLSIFSNVDKMKLVDEWVTEPERDIHFLGWCPTLQGPAKNWLCEKTSKHTNTGRAWHKTQHASFCTCIYFGKVTWSTLHLQTW